MLLHKATVYFLSFHFALPECAPDAECLQDCALCPCFQVPVRATVGSLMRQAPLPSSQAFVCGPAWAFWLHRASSLFVWTKLVKVLARAMRSRGLKCL